jgi:hypothetical protein
MALVLWVWSFDVGPAASGVVPYLGGAIRAFPFSPEIVPARLLSIASFSLITSPGVKSSQWVLLVFYSGM